MSVDKSGRDNVPISVDSLTRAFANFSDRRYLALGDSHVAAKPRHAAAINDRAIAND
jgi:hypothetical protein